MVGVGAAELERAYTFLVGPTVDGGPDGTDTFVTGCFGMASDGVAEAGVVTLKLFGMNGLATLLDGFIGRNGFFSSLSARLPDSFW